MTPENYNRNRMFGLRKADRLHHRTLVNALFKKGNSISAYPLRLVWRKFTMEELKAEFKSWPMQDIGPMQFMITVPKKKRRKAVDRVLMRRRIRESYRLNRIHLEDQLKKIENHGSLSMALIYISEHNCEYRKIENSIRKILEKLATTIDAQEDTRTTS